MSNKICGGKLIYLFVCSMMVILGVCISGSAQSRVRVRSQTAVPRSISVLDGTKEEDGLLGPVRYVRTETAKLSVKNGKAKEGPRALLETTLYDLDGKRSENHYYPVAETNKPQAKEEYKYDERGNITEMILRAKNGAVLSREVYTYDFDGFGNWTKMTTSLVVYENGLFYEPVEVTYRTISYYFNESLAKAKKSESSPITTQVGLAAKRVESGLLENADKDSAAKDSRPKARLISGRLTNNGVAIPKAIYPEEARRAGVTGTVVVRVTVDTLGNVVEAHPVSGHPLLQAAATEAALKTRFPPQPAKRSTVITFTFSLVK